MDLIQSPDSNQAIPACREVFAAVHDGEVFCPDADALSTVDGHGPKSAGQISEIFAFRGAPVTATKNKNPAEPGSGKKSSRMLSEIWLRYRANIRRLGTFRSILYLKFNVLPFFEGFVSIHFNC